MNTESDAVAETFRGHRPRIGNRQHDAAVLLVGLAGIVGEPLDLYRAADCAAVLLFGFADQHVSVWPNAGGALLLLDDPASSAPQSRCRTIWRR